MYFLNVDFFFWIVKVEMVYLVEIKVFELGRGYIMI